MNGWLHELNAAAVPLLLDHVWPMLWQSSLLILLVALAGRTIFRKSSPQLRYALWSLVLIRLVVPPWVDLPTALGHWGMPEVREHVAAYLPLDAAVPAASAMLQRPLLNDAPPQVAASVADPISDAPPMAAPSIAWSWATLLLAFWGLGVASLLLLLFARLLRLRHDLRRGGDAPDWVLLAISEYRAALGVRWPVRARVVPGNHSPALMGLLRPTVLLPESALANLREDQLRAILAHEIAHVKRRDFLVNWAQVLLGIAYFFHPLLWFANREMRRERELACDDLTLITLGLNREGYAESLLRVAECLSTVRRLAPVQVGVMEGELELARRLRRILDRKIRPVPRLTALSLATVIAFAAVLGTWHQTVAENETVTAVPTEKVETRTLEVKVVDEAGKPLEGVELEVQSLRTAVNSVNPGVWHSNYGGSRKHLTGADGIATVPYPRYLMPRSKSGDVTLPADLEGLVNLEAFQAILDRMSKTETGVVALTARLNGYAASERLEFGVGEGLALVVLKAGSTVRVTAYIGERSGDVAPVLVNLDGPAYYYWQTDGSAVFERKDLALGPHCLWLSHEAPDGTIYFSDPLTFVAEKGVIHEYRLPVRKGVRLFGHLDESIARPVKNGWVQVRVCPREAVGPFVSDMVEWSAQAPVSPDGAFELIGLPHGHAEVIAACDGAVSNGAILSGNERQGVPIVADLTRDENELELTMVATATAVVHLTNLNGEPLEGALVYFSPNTHFFQRYSDVFEKRPYGSAEYHHLAKDELIARCGANGRSYWCATDANGTAVIKNLPPWTPEFAAELENNELLVNEQGMRQLPIELHPGKTTEATARLVATGADVIVADPRSVAKTPKPMPAGLAAAIAAEREKMNADPFALPTTPASPANRFEGKVVDESGTPLAGVRVDAWTWCPGKETDSAADGTFALDGFDLDQRTIEVRIAKEGFSPIYMFRQPLGALVDPVVLTTRTYLEGTVTDSAGKPVAGALIRADAGPRDAEGVHLGETITSTQSGADGAYHFPVQHGAYTVSVVAGPENATLKDVAVAQYEAKGLDIQLQPGAVFRAVVIDSVTKKPVEGVRLANWRRKEFEGVSDASGNIEIAGMPEGPFQFDVHGDALGIKRWWSENTVDKQEREYVRTDRNWQRNFDGLTFNIAPDMPPVTIVTEQGARVRGTVLDPEGKPVAGATVAPALTGTSNSLTGDTRFSVITNDQGAFEILLPASKIREYNLIAHDGDFEVWRTWANGVMDPITTQPGDVIENVEIRLQRPCVIRGKAVDEAGEPLAQREVRAAAKAQNDNRYYVPTTRTDAEGNFELKFVAPGEHYVQVAPFWLNPAEAPEGSGHVVNVAVDAPVENVVLVGKSE